MATITAAEPETAPPIPAYRRGSKLRLRNTLIGWSFILPNFIGFAPAHPGAGRGAVLHVVHELERLRQGGLDRPRELPAAVGDGSFWIALRNTLYYSALHIPLTIVVVAGPGAAAQPQAARRGVLPHRRVLPLHHLDRRARRACGTCSSAPSTGRSTSSCGSSASTTRPAGRPRPTGRCPRSSSSSTWRDMGYYMILFLAGLQTIPRELYEAAGSTAPAPGSGSVNVTLPVPAPHHVLRHRDADHQLFKVFDLILRHDRRRPRPVDPGAVAVHLPEGLRGEPVRLRLGRLHRAVRHLLPRHDRPVPGATSGGSRVMTPTLDHRPTAAGAVADAHRASTPSEPGPPRRRIASTSR